MKLYRCKLVGDGLTLETAFRPDVPQGARWSCVIDHGDQTMTIAVADDLTNIPPDAVTEARPLRDLIGAKLADDVATSLAVKSAVALEAERITP